VGNSANITIDNGKFAVNGKINLEAGSTKDEKENLISTSLEANSNVYCHEIVTSGKHTNTKIDGTLYIEDDMEFNKSNTIMNIGTWMGFNDTSDSSMSSAILFNDKNGLESVTVNIGKAFLAGTAFLGDLGYKTGESVSVRGNYRAYQGMIKDEFIDSADDNYIYRSSNVIFKNYGGLSLFDDYKGRELNADSDITSHKTKYFMLSYNMSNRTVDETNPSPFITITPNFTNLDDNNGVTMTVGNWAYSTGVCYNNGWFEDITSDEAEAEKENAGKDYEKHTKYFGYGEGNKHREIEEGKTPVVVGESGWINSGEAFANLIDAHGIYPDVKADEIVVVVSNGNDPLELTDSINGKKGIIIAGGDIKVNGTSDIIFDGIIICGGNLIINNNFTVNSSSVALNKIVESAIGGDDPVPDGEGGYVSDGKALYKLFRDDGSGNLYTISTIDSTIASVNMNELIKISEWNKSKFEI